MYKCELCNKEFDRKYNLQQHLKRKIACNNIIQCSNCLNQFKTKQGLLRHKDRKNPCEKVNLEQENKKLKEKIEQLEKTSTRAITNNNTNNTTNNNINIQLDKLYITTDSFKEIKKILKYSNGLNQLCYNDIIQQANLLVDENTKSTIKMCKDTENNFTLEKNYNHLKSDMIMKFVKLLCFNINNPENWIFIYDYLFKKMKVKINNNLEDINNQLILIVYTMIKGLIIKDTKKELHESYYIFIDRYENNFKLVDEDENIEYGIKFSNFLINCSEKMLLHFRELEKELNETLKELKN